MRILVTGGAGFIGNPLVASLAKDRNNTVSVFDGYVNGFPKKFPTKKNIESPLSGNIRSLSHVASALQKFTPDTIIHMAAHPTRPEAVGNFRECAEVNYVGAVNLLKACMDSKERPKKIIFTSSLAAVNTPGSHFGISKRASEQLFESLCGEMGISYTTLRLSEVYGVSASPTSDSEVHFLINNMLLNRNIVVYGPNEHRDYMHVSDAVRAIELVVRSDEQVPLLDVGTGEPVVTKDLVNKLRKLTKHAGKVRLTEDPRINIVSYVADTSLAKEKFGFVCEKNFDEGLKELVSKRKKELK
jgi:nucleoside-diphosphate-sugar epimerase